MSSTQATGGVSVDRIATDNANYRILTAHSGHDALDVLLTQRQEICLLVTDVRMPGMNGPTLARRASQFYPGLPIRYVSGYSDYEDQIPASACLEKPFAAKNLLERVQAVMSLQPVS